VILGEGSSPAFKNQFAVLDSGLTDASAGPKDEIALLAPTPTPLDCQS
jgi:hypothetical protein